MEDYKKRILKILSSANEPLDVEKIRRRAKIGHWNACLHHLLELYILGKIEGRKTSKSWIFWIKKGG
ncbi:MAG: hypothetical protein QW589_01415 [Candidatus Bathyarchaeia archaeon]